MIIFELIYIAYADLEASGGWRFQPPNPENLTYKKIIDLPTKNRPLTPPPHPSKQIKLSLRPPIKNFLIRAFTNWCTIIWGRNNPQGGKSHNRKPTNVHDITLPKICKYKSLWEVRGNLAVITRYHWEWGRRTCYLPVVIRNHCMRYLCSCPQVANVDEHGLEEHDLNFCTYSLFRSFWWTFPQR